MMLSPIDYDTTRPSFRPCVLQGISGSSASNWYQAVISKVKNATQITNTCTWNILENTTVKGIAMCGPSYAPFNSISFAGNYVGLSYAKAMRKYAQIPLDISDSAWNNRGLQAPIVYALTNPTESVVFLDSEDNMYTEYTSTKNRICVIDNTTDEIKREFTPAQFSCENAYNRVAVATAHGKDLLLVLPVYNASHDIVVYEIPTTTTDDTLSPLATWSDMYDSTDRTYWSNNYATREEYIAYASSKDMWRINSDFTLTYYKYQRMPGSISRGYTSGTTYLDGYDADVTALSCAIYNKFNSTAANLTTALNLVAGDILTISYTIQKATA